ncbi:MAG: glycosyltransferase family 2 protein [SAR324 cluster bacterium]|jgi:glycosyltransferase involved in cell wall biosynthesis
MKIISFVIPVYQEKDNLVLMYEALQNMMTGQSDQYDWDVIFVNDGSPDGSGEILEQLSQKEARCRVIELSRNFGKEIALSAGVDYAKGDAVIFLDADLQHPPDRIPDMLRCWEDGYEVVEMVRTYTEGEPWLRRLGSTLFYKILKFLSSTDILAKTTDFRLLDRKVVQELRRVEERQRMFRGIIDWLGFRKVRLDFEAPARKYGTPVYSYSKLLNLALNSFISYSSLPLKFIGALGVGITVISGLVLFWMTAVTLFADEYWNITPVAFIVVSNLVFTGVTLSALGLMSLYISKIYSEVQNRPLYTIRRTINIDESNSFNGLK